MSAAPAIGILGGTFDPIHNGHLRLGWEAQTQLALQSLHMIPCHIPTHRGSPSVTSEHRLAMTELGCAEVPGFIVNDIEIRRNTASYSVETLQQIRDSATPTSPLIFIMGMDAFCTFSRWHQWQQILTLAHLWVALRPGSQLPAETTQEFELLEALGTPSSQDLLEQPAGRIHIYPSTALDISATRLRQDMAQGLAPRFLMPDSVWQYIRKNKLYNVRKNCLDTPNPNSD